MTHKIAAGIAALALVCAAGGRSSLACCSWVAVSRLALGWP